MWHVLETQRSETETEALGPETETRHSCCRDKTEAETLVEISDGSVSVV